MNKRIIEILFLAGFFLFVFIYIIIRAYSIPIIHDEAATFFYYIQSGIFMPPAAHPDANNHILNSALSHYSYILFGSSVFFLRLPSVLFFPFFFAYVVKIGFKLKSKIFSWAFIISLVFSHSFIEYFALSRGYGMSMALLVAAIFHLLESIENNRIKDYFLTAIFMSLAIFANLTLAITGLMFAVILIINALISSKKILKLSIISTLLLLPLLWFIALLFDYKNGGALYYGTLDGFWSLTVRSLIKLLFTPSIILEILTAILFIFTITIFLRKIIINKLSSLWHQSNLFAILLFGNISGILILAYVFGINFPEDRTGLYLFPLFVGGVFFAFDSINFEKIAWIKYSVLPIAILIPFHFVWSMNISHSTFWKSELIPSRFIEKVKNNNPQATISGDHIRVLIWAYYNSQTSGKMNQIQDLQFPNNATDYLLINKMPNDTANYSVIDFEAISNMYLLKNKETFQWQKLNMQKGKDNNTLISNEFYGFYENKIDSIIKDNNSVKTLAFSLNFKLNSKAVPLNARVVLTVNDRNNNSIYYYYQQLDWKKKSWIGNQHNLRFIVPNINKEAYEIKVYLWNINKSEYQIEDVEYGVEVF